MLDRADGEHEMKTLLWITLFLMQPAFAAGSLEASASPATRTTALDRPVDGGAQPDDAASGPSAGASTPGVDDETWARALAALQDRPEARWHGQSAAPGAPWQDQWPEDVGEPRPYTLLRIQL